MIRSLFIPSIYFERGRDIWRQESANHSFQRRFKKLSGRALLMAGPEDRVMVDTPPENAYADLLGACGVGGCETIIPAFREGACLSEDAAHCPAACKTLAEWEGSFDLYMPSAYDHQLGAATGRTLTPCPAPVSELLNDKVFFFRLLEDRGIPQPSTFVGTSHAIMTRLQSDKPQLVRAAHSVGGSALFPCRTARERQTTKAFLSKVKPDHLYLLHEWKNVTASPNLQFYVDDEAIHFFGLSQQQFAGPLRHNGNLFDGSGDAGRDAEMIATARGIVFEAAALGYRGVVGVDFILTDQGESFTIEMNARHNSSSYGLFFANRLLMGNPLIVAPSGRGAYLALPAPCNRTVAEWLLLLGKEAFDPKRIRGIMPMAAIGDELAAVIIGEGENDRAELMERARQVAATG